MKSKPRAPKGCQMTSFFNRFCVLDSRWAVSYQQWSKSQASPKTKSYVTAFGIFSLKFFLTGSEKLGKQMMNLTHFIYLFASGQAMYFILLLFSICLNVKAENGKCKIRFYSFELLYQGLAKDLVVIAIDYV